MRIAYLINQYPKVTHSFIRREILALERQGLEVMRISIRGQDSQLWDLEDLLEQKKTHYVLEDGAFALIAAMLHTLFTRPIHFVRALVLASRMGRHSERPLPIHLIYLAEACRVQLWLRDRGIAHLHAHFGTNSAEVAMLVHVLGGPPWSFTVHGPEEFDKPQFIGLAEKIRRCAFVVAISSFGRSQLFRNAEYRHWSKVHVVHCGVEPQFYSGALEAASISRSLVCVGRLCEQKGQLLLIDAARILVERGADFKLVLAGDGDERSAIEELVTRYALESRIRITGWISGSQVRDEILSSRALVLPSFAEGLPVVIMEAMALKRPVISTYVAGIPELVLPGINGWLTPAGDATALADAMLECLEKPLSVITSMGDAAFAEVVKRHDIDLETVKLAELFQLSLEGDASA
jgi:glycosyltransferase involved in cell wall biosynthesis